MSDVYRKYGRSLRYEHGVFVRVDEAGEAVDDGQTFICRPIPRSVELPSIGEERLHNAVREIESMITPPLAIERLLVSEGVIEHEMGGRKWSDTTFRIHLSMTMRDRRVLLDFADLSDDIRSVAEEFRRAGPERTAPARMTLAPNVSAALLPSLVGIAPPNIKLWQLAGGIDGKGAPVETAEISSPTWPNWYRPSYRTKPVRAPFNLSATCDVTEIEPGLPRAIALLAPPAGIQLNVLISDGGDVYPALVHINRIDAIAPASRWFPYAAGSFGAEMML